MPRIKRWFPVSHSFNRDPEVRELRRQFGNWTALVWQEMCSIADMNEGEVPGKADEIADSLAYISMKKRPSIAAKVIRNSFSFMQVSGWIRIETDRVLILKYAKYHRTGEHNPVPPDLPDLPNHTRPKRSPEKRGDPDSEPSLKSGSDSEIRKGMSNPETKRLSQAFMRLTNRDPERYGKLDSAIKGARTFGAKDNQIADLLEEIELREKNGEVQSPCSYFEAAIKQRVMDANAAEEERRNNELKKAPISGAMGELIAQLSGKKAVR